MKIQKVTVALIRSQVLLLYARRKKPFHTVFQKSLLYSMQDSAPTSITLLAYYKTLELKQHTPTFLEE